MKIETITTTDEGEGVRSAYIDTAVAVDSLEDHGGRTVIVLRSGTRYTVEGVVEDIAGRLGLQHLLSSP